MRIYKKTNSVFSCVVFHGFSNLMLSFFVIKVNWILVVGLILSLVFSIWLDYKTGNTSGSGKQEDIAPVRTLADFNGDPLMLYNWHCGIDTDTIEEEVALTSTLYEKLRTFHIEQSDIYYSLRVQGREEERATFYDMYGSLFFLGIMLSVVFLLAAALIIYYKQISEGYEDHSRFEIMQKVGMTKRDIKKSINSQMLTVFFLPLLLAGVHLGFAFPFVTKIFRLFAFDNLALSILVNVVCFVAFGVFYAIVYKITSHVYFGIVSGKKE